MTVAAKFPATKITKSQAPSAREEQLRNFLEKVRNRPKREYATVKMKNGGWAVVKKPI